MHIKTTKQTFDINKLISDIKRFYNFDVNAPYGGVPVDVIHILAMIDEQRKLEELK